MSEIEQHIERAKKAYKSFKLLWKNKLYEDSASRGYYTLVHLASALFIKEFAGLMGVKI